MNKVFNVIVIAVVLFLLFKMGISFLYFVARFWYIWVAIIAFIVIKKRYFPKSTSKKKKTKDYVDADFTIIEDDKSEKDDENNEKD
ncbi:MAG: hypothetical protein K8S23_01650 [Candidatus Cloacimonetes bacterium]|nr:hypothetical protein [Candidatus Cloacimonadota bacterium]